jgi:hypothetical protein
MDYKTRFRINYLINNKQKKSNGVCLTVYVLNLLFYVTANWVLV